MKTIPLNSRKYPGLLALVDDEDYERVLQYRWFPTRGSRGRTFYAGTNVAPGKQVSLHRMILGAGDGVEVDHINHNGLDCQRHNLREVRHAQNSANVPTRSSTKSGYKGVCFTRGKWIAQLKVGGIQMYLGSYDTAEKAARVYDAAVRYYIPEHGVTNFDGQCAMSAQEIRAANIGEMKQKTSSRFIGVSWRRDIGKWVAQTKVNGMPIRIGYFLDEEVAARARDEYVREYLTDAYKLNFT